MQFFTVDSSKIEVFKTCVFDIVTTQNDHPRYVTHVVGRIYVFFTLFGYWAHVGGGLPKDWYTTCFMQFFTLDNSTIEVFETYFFDIVIT